MNMLLEIINGAILLLALPVVIWTISKCLDTNRRHLRIFSVGSMTHWGSILLGVGVCYGIYQMLLADGIPPDPQRGLRTAAPLLLTGLIMILAAWIVRRAQCPRYSRGG